MPVFGYKLKPFNLPTDTFFGTTVNTITGATTPSGTPATNTAFVWFDAGIKKWRVKYDNGTIESLGVGTSGAADHKNTHVSNGSDDFDKGDELDCAARYIENIADPASDSQRFWLVSGGAEIRYWDDQSTPVKQTVVTTATPQTISSKTFDGTNDLSAGLVSSNVAFTNINNLFTINQDISFDDDTILSLTRPVNTINAIWGLEYWARDSGSAAQEYAEINAVILDNTAGAEDARIDFAVVDEGSLSTRFRINDNGLTEVFGAAGATDVFRIDRDSGTNGDAVGMLYRLNDSLGNSTDMGRMRCEIVDNTDGSEDAKLRIALMSGGSMQDRAVLNTDGSMEHIMDSAGADALWLKRPRNTVGDNIAITFQHHNSVNAYNEYARIRSEIVVNTDAAEDGRLEFLTSIDGTLQEVMILDGAGDVYIDRGKLQVKEDATPTFANFYRTDNGVGNQVQINMQLEDSTNAQTTYARVATEIVDATNASEDGLIEFDTMRAGTLTKAATLNQTGQLLINGDAAEEEPLVIERNTSTVGDMCGFYSRMKTADGTFVPYGFYLVEIDANTNAAQTSSLAMYPKKAGVSWRQLELNGDGSSYFKTQADNGDILFLYRPSNTLNDILDVNFDFNNSSATRTTFADIRTVLIEDNAGAEEGRFQINVIQAGVKEEMLRVQNGKLYVGDAATGVGGVPRTYNRSGTPVNFNNTSAEQTLFTQNIVGNDMGSSGILKLLLCGSIRQQTVTSTTYTLRIKFGGTTGYQDDVISAYATSSANYLIWKLELNVYNQNSTSVQAATGSWILNDNASVTTGWGDITDDEGQGGQVFACSWAKDTTVNNTLAVTMQASTASASVEYNVDYKELMLTAS